LIAEELSVHVVDTDRNIMITSCMFSVAYAKPLPRPRSYHRGGFFGHLWGGLFTSRECLLIIPAPRKSQSNHENFGLRCRGLSASHTPRPALQEASKSIPTQSCFQTARFDHLKISSPRQGRDLHCTNGLVIVLNLVRIAVTVRPQVKAEPQEICLQNRMQELCYP